MNTEAEAIAAEIRDRDTWDNDLCFRLCDLAGMGDAYKAADGDTFEAVVFQAAGKLGVDVIREN